MEGVPSRPHVYYMGELLQGSRGSLSHWDGVADVLRGEWGVLQRGARGVLKLGSPSSGTLPGTSCGLGVQGDFQLGSPQYETLPGGCWGYRTMGVLIEVSSLRVSMF